MVHPVATCAGHGPARPRTAVPSRPAPTAASRRWSCRTRSALRARPPTCYAGVRAARIVSRTAWEGLSDGRPDRSLGRRRQCLAGRPSQVHGCELRGGASWSRAAACGRARRVLGSDRRPRRPPAGRSRPIRRAHRYGRRPAGRSSSPRCPGRPRPPCRRRRCPGYKGPGRDERGGQAGAGRHHIDHRPASRSGTSADTKTSGPPNCATRMTCMCAPFGLLMTGVGEGDVKSRNRAVGTRRLGPDRRVRPGVAVDDHRVDVGVPCRRVSDR